ncbi:FMN-binding protein [Streptomyces fructofermentans]|uniref:FMN-binding protein n=1 Tax=Streptomyces fructofermentans TaxID=152141 RepID=UPI0037AEE242
MKRALPALLLTVAGLIPVWRYAPSDTAATAEAAPALPAPSPSPSSGASSPASPDDASRVVQGSTVATEKGAVQVEVTFDGDTIDSVRMLKQPDHPQTTNAVPKLIEETLRAQSADIDAVSGATITSEGYAESLQAAIDAQG